MSYGRRSPGESIFAAVRRFIPDMVPHVLGRLWLYSCESATPEGAPNRVADKLISRLGYGLPGRCVGLIAVSSAGDALTGDVPSFPPEVITTIGQLE
ncbi:MAG: hypothetical protein QOG76_4017 [Pseudonocardiales bacterium]|jgi:hypothetical protein|nr:hypothetical protein [Pseudonocardiales bacterium]